MVIKIDNKSEIRVLIDSVISDVCEDDSVKVEFFVKCKTKDGHVETFEMKEFSKEDNEDIEDYKGRIESEMTELFIDTVDSVENDEFSIFLNSMVSVRNSEIVRIWVEPGTFYIESETFII